MSMCIANGTYTPTTSFNPPPGNTPSPSFTPSNLHFPTLPTETNLSFDASMTTYIHDLYLFPNQASQQGCAPLLTLDLPLHETFSVFPLAGNHSSASIRI